MAKRQALASRPVVIAASLVSFALVGLFLYFTRDILIPLALAILLTFLLSPLVTRLDKLGVHRVVSVLLAVLLVAVCLTGLILFVGMQLQGLAEEVQNESYRENIKGKLQTLRENMRGGPLDGLFATFQEAAHEIDEKEKARRTKAPMPVRIVPDDSPDKSFRDLFEPLVALRPLLDPLATAGLALILLIFMLVEREDLRNRLVSFTGFGGLTTTTKALDDAAHRLGRYLLMQLVINSSFGLMVMIGLWLIGVPYAPLWGLCGAVCRYVPYIGAWVAALLPAAFCLITFPGWNQFLFTVGLFVLLETIGSNALEPWLYGHGMGVSQVALLVSAAFWAWIWGPVGLILSAPLTVCVAVLGKYVPSLAFLDRLLGAAPPLPAHVVYLQRLLARDAREAQGIVEEHVRKGGAATVYDELLVPALVLAKEERDRGLMSAEDEALVLTSTSAILRTLGKAHAPIDGMPASFIIGCPARQEVDELALQMLDQRLDGTGRGLNIVSTHLLPSDVVAHVRREQPAAIVISAVAPGGLVQAAYLCRRLRKVAPSARIIVGHFGYRRNLDRIITKLRSAGANYVSTTLQGVQSHLPDAVVAVPALQAAVPASPAT